MDVLAFLKEYWVLVVVALLLLFVVRLFVKTLFKIALLVVVVGLVLVYVFGFSPNQVVNLGEKGVQTATDVFHATIQPIIQAELQDAKLTFLPDGQYQLQTAHTKIIGKKGDSRATVWYGDHSYEVDLGSLNSAVQARVEELSKQTPQ